MCGAASAFSKTDVHFIMYISVRIVAVWKLKGSYHAFSCSFIITCISLDSYLSDSHCKFNAVPEELLSNLTMSERHTYGAIYVMQILKIISWQNVLRS